jgi:hypothetical protein
MANVQPLARENLGEFEQTFELVGRATGFAPRSLFAMPLAAAHLTGAGWEAAKHAEAGA